jgi:hypothetical protein
MDKRKWWVLGAGLLLLPAVASAQLYKCKGPDGKIVYSDSRCEAADTGALKVTPMGTTPSEREKAAVEKAAADKAAAEKAAADKAAWEKGIPPGMVLAPAPVAAPVRKPYEATSSDNQRLRNLEVDSTRAGAYSEQKSAFEMEAHHIRSGRDAALSSDDKARRDAFHADLSSTDAKKRREALEGLRRLYY